MNAIWQFSEDLTNTEKNILSLIKKSELLIRASIEHVILRQIEKRKYATLKNNLHCPTFKVQSNYSTIKAMHKPLPFLIPVSSMKSSLLVTWVMSSLGQGRILAWISIHVCPPPFSNYFFLQGFSYASVTHN